MHRFRSTYPGRQDWPSCAHSENPRRVNWVDAQARIKPGLQRGATRTVILTSRNDGDGRIGFWDGNGDAASVQPTDRLSLTLGADSDVHFRVSGNAGSSSANDVKIVPQDPVSQPPQNYTAHPMTVFWYDAAKLTLEPKRSYKLSKTQRTKAIDFSGEATVRPEGMDRNAPILESIRITFIQNGAFRRIEIRDRADVIPVAGMTPTIHPVVQGDSAEQRRLRLWFPPNGAEPTQQPGQPDPEPVPIQKWTQLSRPQNVISWMEGTGGPRDSSQVSRGR